MNVLMVCHAPPFPPDLGPARRHYHVLRQLARRHRVHVLSFGTDADKAALLRHFGDAVASAVYVPVAQPAVIEAMRRSWFIATARSDFRRLYHRPFQRALTETVRRLSPDLVWLSTTMLGCYRVPGGIAVLGDTHNVEHDNLDRAWRHTREPLRRTYYRLQAALTRREEVRFNRQCDLVCATSPRDAGIIRAARPGVPVRVVPNGIDMTRFDPGPPERREPRTVLFTGLMSYYPNAHGVMWLLDAVWPLVLRRAPDARLLIVGARPSRALLRRRAPGVEITGYVPDVRPYFARARVFLVPLHIGGGTRVKILEALATATPVVTTRVGCEGLDIVHGQTALVGETAEDLAASVVRLFEDRPLHEALASEGRALAGRYDWNTLLPVLDEACAETLASHAGARSARLPEAGRAQATAG